MKQVLSHRNVKPQSMTWASYPGPTLTPAGLYFFTDVGINGSLWYNTGISIRPVSDIVIQDSVLGFILPSLAAANAATYSQSGTTLTVTSAAHTMVAALNGSSIYLIVGTVSTGVAPVAPVDSGWFTNFTYVDANTFTCTAGNSQTGTGNINSNLTEIVVTGLTVVLKGGLLGTSLKSLHTLAEYSATTAAGNKNIKHKIDGSLYHNPVVTSGSYIYRAYAKIAALSNTIQSVLLYIYSGWGGTTVAPARLTKDTTTDKSITLTLQVEAANQYCAVLNNKVYLN
jgi:hypothetical protein